MTIATVIPDTSEVHGYTIASRSSVGTAPPLAIPTGRWTTDDVYPEPGSTFSWVQPACFHGWTTWLLEEDRAQSRADLAGLDKVLRKLTKAALTEIARELGCWCPPAKKRDLVITCTIRQMDRWWPWKVQQ